MLHEFLGDITINLGKSPINLNERILLWKVRSNELFHLSKKKILFKV